MTEDAKKKVTITPTVALEGESPLVLVAEFRPIAGLDRFQPAGFPEVGHVVYKAPREKNSYENVCVVDSAASMANHLESVCMRGAHDLDLVDDLDGMPYLRCVTGDLDEGGRLPPERRELHVTSLTEGHRVASTYFFGTRPKKTMKWDGKAAQRVLDDGAICSKSFGDELAETDKFGIALDGNKAAYAPPARWWHIFQTIFRYDPNALVHGVMFPQWQIKIPRVLTAHLEAFGAARVDRSGVKFDRLGKTNSGQPIFAVDETTAQVIRATFILDLALLRSFGRQNGDNTLGLTEGQKEFLVALALWKIRQLLAAPFRFRSGCHLQCTSLKRGEEEVALDVDIRRALANAGFKDPRVTDIYWPRAELYRPGKGATGETEGDQGPDGDDPDTDSDDPDADADD